jgi:hypothetical protein
MTKYVGCGIVKTLDCDRTMNLHTPAFDLYTDNDVKCDLNTNSTTSEFEITVHQPSVKYLMDQLQSNISNIPISTMDPKLWSLDSGFLGYLRCSIHHNPPLGDGPYHVDEPFFLFGKTFNCLDL